jgi:hypothetical protein
LARSRVEKKGYSLLNETISTFFPEKKSVRLRVCTSAIGPGCQTFKTNCSYTEIKLMQPTTTLPSDIAAKNGPVESADLISASGPTSGAIQPVQILAVQTVGNARKTKTPVAKKHAADSLRLAPKGSHQPTTQLSLPAEGFVQLNRIIKPLGPIPIGKSTWWVRVKDGTYPKPDKRFGKRISTWDVKWVRTLIE